MIDLVIERMSVTAARLDQQLRSEFNEIMAGISTGPYGVRIHFLQPPTSVQQVQAQTIVNAHRSLALITSKPVIQANGSDAAMITCGASAIDGDSTVTYTVWLDDEEYTAPTSVPVTAGQVQLNLSTNDPGAYRIEIARQGTGNFETGEIVIYAEEV